MAKDKELMRDKGWEGHHKIITRDRHQISLLILTLPVLCIPEGCIEIKIKGLEKTFWGTIKKCENTKFLNFIFSLRPGLGREGLSSFEQIN